MPYIKRTTWAGRVKEVELYYTARYNKPGLQKAKRQRPTREQQKAINRKQAERKLRGLLNANFRGGDLHLILTYIRKKGQPYRTFDEMKEDARKFIRICRRIYRKAGKEFKYIHVMEIGDKGARHHHLVVNDFDHKLLQEAWNKVYKSRIKFVQLDDSGQYADLAAYLIKYTDKHLRDPAGQRLQGKRWSASRNLARPIEKKEIITERKYFRSEVRVPAGWYEDKARTERGVTSPEYGGYGFFRYTLIRLE